MDPHEGSGGSEDELIDLTLDDDEDEPQPGQQAQQAQQPWADPAGLPQRVKEEDEDWSDDDGDYSEGGDLSDIGDIDAPPPTHPGKLADEQRAARRIGLRDGACRWTARCMVGEAPPLRRSAVVQPALASHRPSTRAAANSHQLFMKCGAPTTCPPQPTPPPLCLPSLSRQAVQTRTGMAALVMTRSGAGWRGWTRSASTQR